MVNGYRMRLGRQKSQEDKDTTTTATRLAEAGLRLFINSGKITKSLILQPISEAGLLD